MPSETSSAREIGKGIYNGKNKIGKTVSLRSTIIRENEKLNKHNFAAKYQLVYNTSSFYKKPLQFSEIKVLFLFIN